MGVEARDGRRVLVMQLELPLPLGVVARLLEEVDGALFDYGYVGVVLEPGGRVTAVPEGEGAGS